MQEEEDTSSSAPLEQNDIREEGEEEEEEDLEFSPPSRTVGPKVITARLIRDRIGDGCRICALNRQVENAAAPENA